MLFKTTPQYIDTDPNFKPGPKYGHLSKPNPRFEVIRQEIDKMFAQLQDIPNLETFRAFSPQTDAPIPPGGPDREKEIITETLTFPARDGHEIELKVYKSPNAKQENTALLYRMHGGGWVVGNHESDGAECVYAAALCNLIVGTRKPIPPATARLIRRLSMDPKCQENAARLGIDPTKVIVGANSAGGSLAAALCLEAQKLGLSGIIAQVLHFPATCHPKVAPRDKYEYGSYTQNKDGPILSTPLYEFCLDSHVPDVKPDPRHSPLLAESLENLPPALIQCAGLDLLRDDAFAYAEALKEANVDTEIHAYEGLPHCFPIVLLDFPETK